jgi:hypothetical protein
MSSLTPIAERARFFEGVLANQDTFATMVNKHSRREWLIARLAARVSALQVAIGQPKRGDGDGPVVKRY